MNQKLRDKKTGWTTKTKTKNPDRQKNDKEKLGDKKNDKTKNLDGIM